MFKRILSRIACDIIRLGVAALAPWRPTEPEEDGYLWEGQVEALHYFSALL